MRVLIVEDEPNLAETLREMLKQNRFDSDICLVISGSSMPYAPGP